jgi:hypothetical protein
MNPILRNVGAVIAGLIVGSVVNMSLISISGSFIPPPTGADITSMEGLKATMHLMEPKHFLFPFLAHALGTLVGAWVAAMIAVGNKLRSALIVGFFFMAGGIANVIMLPSPLWYSIVDIVVAYVPMALLGSRLSGRSNG